MHDNREGRRNTGTSESTRSCSPGTERKDPFQLPDAQKKSWHGDQDLNREKTRYSISHRYRASSSAATPYRMGLTCRPRPLSSLIAA